MDFRKNTKQSFWDVLPHPFFVLAPMEAVTDVVFRHVVREAGAPDLFFTEFANATGWVQAGDQAIRGRLVKTDDEQPIVAQIWGGEPGDMESFARHCAELGYDGIDINMGCPAKSAVRSGGSALIQKPDVAIAAIAAAKTAGLPVSVKTRLGYTYVDEWKEWLATLLQQDIAALTIHLRTKREMSKVPAHHELIPDIKKLRDELAPGTLLIINGDIRDREHGLELVEQYGVDGVMIGRGVFQNPFCFAKELESEKVGKLESEEAHTSTRTQSLAVSVDTSATSQQRGKTDEVVGAERGGDGNMREIAEIIHDWSGDRKEKLINLLRYHLDLFDTWQPTLNRPFETLKRFFKIYIRDFDGASDLRAALMLTSSTNEVRELLTNHEKSVTF